MGGSEKVHFPDLKKYKNMLSKCIKLPKYSFKRYLFFAIWGGSLTESGLPTTPHMHYVSHTMHCVGRAVHFVSLTAHCVNRTKVWQETFSQHQVQNFFFWHFLRWKNKFFQNCSKLPKNHFRTIKILFFFSRFSAITRLGGWVRPNLENSRFFC